MNARFVPTFRVGDLVLAERFPGPHFESLWVGAHDDDRDPDGGAIPVVVHSGPVPWNGLDADSAAQLGDELAYIRRCLALKQLLAGQGVPRVLRLVFDDRVSTTEPIGYVEEHAGDVSIEQLLRENAAVGGRLPIGVCLALARSIAIPYVALSMASSGVRMGTEPRGTFIDDRGVVRSLVEPLPGWRDMATGTAVGVIRRNFHYFSPEEVRGLPLDLRAPMFGLGLLLFELVAGHHPFQAERAESPIAMLQALYGADVPSLAAHRQDVPAPVASLVERLTRREREQRFDSWSAVLAALDGVMERTERASERDIAAICDALCPELMAAARDRREEIAVANLAVIPLPDHPNRRLGARHIEVQRGHLIHDEVSTWEGPTPPEIDAPFIGQDGQPMWRLVLEGDADIGDWPRPPEGPQGTAPRVLLVDAAPVSHTAWARFCIETGRPPPPAWGGPVPAPELGDTPVTDVGFDDAVAYARHYGKELPTEALWLAAAHGLGAARLQMGAVWEWTATPRRGGHVVRGGRFRDHPTIASDGFSASWEDAAASDLGFRCVIRESGPDDATASSPPRPAP